MANFTGYLNLEKPLQEEYYDVDKFNANADKIDDNALENYNQYNNIGRQITMLGETVSSQYDEFKNHANNMNNPHGTTPQQIGAATTGDLSAHTSRTDNPHGVTPAQLGLVSEAGTFTPVLNFRLNGGGTALVPLSQTSGIYRREGNLVYFSLYLQIASHSVTDSIRALLLDGLPFINKGYGSVFDSAIRAASYDFLPDDFAFWALANNGSQITGTNVRATNVILGSGVSASVITEGMGLMLDGVYTIN